MNKHDLVNALEGLNFQEGFQIVSSTFIFGVRRVDILDTDSIVFATWGGELFTYWLQEWGYEDIADEIEKYIVQFDNGEVDGYLSLSDCRISKLV